jgi:hypothetical protein
MERSLVPVTQTTKNSVMLTMNSTAPPRMRQTRIEHGQKVEIVEEIEALVQVMDQCEEREMALLLHELESDLSHLSSWSKHKKERHVSVCTDEVSQI